MLLSTLRRPALLLALVFAVAIAALFLFSTPSAEAAGVLNVDMKVTFGEDKGVGDGTPDDAIFKVHDAKNNGISGVKISVRYISNNTEIVNLTTDATGLAQLLNLTHDNYTYLAYDKGYLFGWGNFSINTTGVGWAAQIGHGHSVFMQQQPGIMDDFSFGAKHNEGGGYNDSWVEIWNITRTQLLYSGYANSDDPYGDSWVRAFIKQNLSAGMYWFESYSNITGGNFLQNGTFYIVFDAWFWDWEWFDVDWDYDYLNETKLTYFDVDTNSGINTTLIVDIFVFDSNGTKFNFTRMYINVTGDDNDRFWFNWSANFSDWYTVRFYLYAMDGKHLYHNFTIVENWLEVEYDTWFYQWDWEDQDRDQDGYNESKQVFFDIDTNTANRTSVYVYVEVLDSNGSFVDYRWFQYNVSGRDLDNLYFYYTTNFSDWYTLNVTLYDEYFTYDYDNFTIVDNWLEVEYDTWFYYWHYYDYDLDEDGYNETKQIYFDIDTNTANRTMVIVDIYVYDSNHTVVNYTTLYFNVTGQMMDYIYFNYTTDFSDWYTVNITLYGAQGRFSYDNFTIHDNWLEVEFDTWFYSWDHRIYDLDQDGYKEAISIWFDIDTNMSNRTQVWVSIEIYHGNGSLAYSTNVSYNVSGEALDSLFFNISAPFSDNYTIQLELYDDLGIWYDNFSIMDKWVQVAFEAYFEQWWYMDIDKDQDGYNETKIIWFDIDTNTSNMTQLWVEVFVYDSNGTKVDYFELSYFVNGTDDDDLYFNWSTQFSDNYTFFLSLQNVTYYEWDNISIFYNWLVVPFNATFYDYDWWDIDDDEDGYNETKVVWFDIDTNTALNETVYVYVMINDSNGSYVEEFYLEFNVTGIDIDNFYFYWETDFSDWYTYYFYLMDYMYYDQDNFTIYNNWQEVEFEAWYYDWEYYDIDLDQDGYFETKSIWFDIDTNTSVMTQLWVEVWIFDSNSTQVDYFELSYYVKGTDYDDFYFNWSTTFSDNYTFFLSLQNVTYYEWDNITIMDNWLEVEFNATFYDLEWWDIDNDEDGYNETKMVWFDIDTNTALNQTVYVGVNIFDSNDTFVNSSFMEYNVSGIDIDNFYFYWDIDFSDWYTYTFYLMDYWYYDQDNFTIIDNWQEVEFEAWFSDWTYYDLDWDQDGYYEMKSVGFDIDTSTSKMSQLWVNVSVYDSNATQMDHFELSYFVNGTDEDDFYFNWSTEFSDNYTFFLSLQNVTYYEWDNISIHDNWLEVEFNATFYDWEWWDIDDDEDGYNETKVVWFDIDTNTALNETVYVYVMINDSNGSYVEEFYLEFNVTGIDIDNFYFYWETDFSDWYTYYFYLMDYMYYDQDNFTIYNNWQEVEFEAWYYDWEYYDIDLDQDGYFETKSIWFDIDTNTSVMTQLWVEVWIFDSNSTQVDYFELSYYVKGTDYDDFYFNWSTTFSDNYTFFLSLQNVTYYEWDNITIMDNWLEVEFNATFYDLEWWDIDNDEDGYNETKMVWFDIDTNTALNQTVYVYLYIMDSNDSTVSSTYLEFNVTGRDMDDLYYAYDANFSDDYTFYLELTDEWFYYQDEFTIYFNWLEVEFETWFYSWDFMEEDYDQDGLNETKLVFFDIDTNTSRRTEVLVEVYIFDSNGTLADSQFLSINVSGMGYDSSSFMWSANFSDFYSFYFDLYDEFGSWYDNFSIIDNWLEVEFEAWFDDWGYDDLDDNDDGFHEMKSVWFDIDSNSSQRTAMYVDVYIFNSTAAEVDHARLRLNISGEAFDVFFFNWTALYNDSYNFYFSLQNETYHEWENFTIVDNWLEVPYETAWFTEKEWAYHDLEGDGFNESINWSVDIDTWNNFTQQGWLVIEITNGTGVFVDSTAIAFDVTGDGQDNGLHWFNWSAQYSDLFTFHISLWNATYDLEFHNQTHDIWLEVAYEYAWFEDKVWDYYDLQGDDFSESLNWTFDIGTWNNYHQAGWLVIEVYNSSAVMVDTTAIPFDVLGESPGDGIYWFNWSAGYTETYTFNISIWNATYDLEFHNQTHDIYLEVAYEFAWFENKEWMYFDGESDGANESINWTFDVDTWIGFTQQGWIVIEIYNSSGMVDSGSLEFQITGEDPTDILYFNWTAPVTDLYTFKIYIFDDQMEVEFHNQVHTDLELELFVGNRIPIATIDSLGPDPAKETDTVHFNGTGLDPDGTVAVYEWYLDDVLFSTTEDFTDTGLAVGSYEVKFRVQDNEGLWSVNATSTFTVVDSTKPQLALLAEPDFDTEMLMLHLRSNEDLIEVNVSLEFTAARATEYVAMAPDTTGDKRNFSGSYGSIDAGDYVITAKGKDLAGNENETTTTTTIKQVTAIKDEPTVVDNKDTTDTRLEIFTKNDTSGKVSVSKTKAPAPLSQEDAEAGVKDIGIFVSIDIDDSILDELDYVNITMYYADSEIPEGVLEASLVLYHYVEATDEWVVADPTGVNLVDNYVWGHVSSFSIFAIFGSNVAPTGNAGPDKTARVGEEVTFEGSAGDLDGQIAFYEWDFDGDGTYDSSSDTTGTATHTYEADGTYTATLRVTDDQGATGFDTVTVKVTRSGGADDDGGGFIPGFPAAVALAVLGGMACLVHRSRPDL